MKIGYNQTIGEVFYTHPVTGAEMGIFMTEDINSDAIQSLVDQYNQDYSMSRIKSNLEGDDRVTGDEVDYIIEQLELFEEGQDQIVTPVEETEVPWEENADTTNIVINKPNVMIEEMPIISLPGTPKLEESKKEKRPRQPRITPVEGSVTKGKKLSSEDYKQLLQEKMVLVDLVDGATNQTTDIPENISKKGRDLILSMDKELSGIVEKYLELIQCL